MIFDYIETFYNPITRVGDTAPWAIARLRAV
jgi:hypothetical protein